MYTDQTFITMGRLQCLKPRGSVRIFQGPKGRSISVISSSRSHFIFVDPFKHTAKLGNGLVMPRIATVLCFVKTGITPFVVDSHLDESVEL